MGGVVPTASQQDRARSEMTISLNRMHRHMRLFQHNNTGEVLVLVNQDIAGYLGPEFVNDWFEVSLSRLQDDYLRKLKVLVSVPGKNATVVEDNLGRTSPTMDSNATEVSPILTTPNTKDTDVKFSSPGPRMATSVISPRGNEANNAANNRNLNEAPGKSNITTSSNLPPAAKEGNKQEPDVLKRLKVLKNAAMEGKSMSMDSSIEFSGSRHLMLDYAADAKPSRPHFKNNGEKSRSKTQLRSYIPTPYLPLGLAKAGEELQVHSFSYNHGNNNNSTHNNGTNAKDTPTSNTNTNDVLGLPNVRLRPSASTPTATSRSLNLQSTPCPACGMVYFGPNSHLAIEEHQWTCYSHRELKSTLEQINTLLRPVSACLLF